MAELSLFDLPLPDHVELILMRPFLGFRRRKPLHTGVRTGCHFLINLSVCASASVCVTFIVFTDCESCTRPISTISGSMESGECGRRRGTCFAARRLEVGGLP